MAVSIRDAQIAYDMRTPDDDPHWDRALGEALEKYTATRDGISELLDEAFGESEDETLDAFIALMDGDNSQPLKNILAEKFQALTGWSRDYAGWRKS